MKNKPDLLLSKPVHYQSEYEIELYSDGSAKLVSSDKIIHFSSEEGTYLIPLIEKIFDDKNNVIFVRDEENNKYTKYITNDDYFIKSSKYFDKYYKNGTYTCKLFNSKEEADFAILQNENEFEAFKKYCKALPQESQSKDKVTLENLTETYLSMKNYIECKFQEANKDGEKLLIPIGEMHSYAKAYANTTLDPSANNLIHELMLLKICWDKGIHHLLIESSDNSNARLEQAKRSEIPKEQIFSKESKEDIGTLIMAEILNNLNEFTSTPVDPLQNDYFINTEVSTSKKSITFPLNEYLEGKSAGKKLYSSSERQDAMNKAIANDGQSAIFIVGALHVPPICTDKSLGSIYKFAPISIYKSVLKPIMSDNTAKKLIFLNDILITNLEQRLNKKYENILSINKIDHEHYQQYIEIRKQALKGFNDHCFLSSTKVLQTKDYDSVDLLTAYKVTLEAIKSCHDKNNVAGTRFIKVLDETFQNNEYLDYLKDHLLDEKLCDAADSDQKHLLGE